MIEDAEKRSYGIVQMRDQVANGFGREGLQQFAFSLGLDWEELQGTGKTARVRDVIVQLSGAAGCRNLLTCWKRSGRMLIGLMSR